MATVNLGSIKFKWKGTYAGGTAYTIDDVVSYNGSSYICIQASTGNLPTDTAYFEQMSQKGSDGTNGTDGTDLTTTLTTQGDLVYRDGSGLQRLGAGTSGQVLQTGGTGANPSWGTVSSDYVKLATVTASGGSSVSLQNYFTSDYNYYELVGTNIISSSDSTLRCRVEVGGTQDSGSAYDWGFLVAWRNSSGGGVDNQTSWQDQDVRMSYNNYGTTLANAGQFTMQIFDPLNTNTYKMFNYQMRASATVNGEIGTTYGGARYRGTSALSGLLFFSNAGTITGTFKLYGVK